MIESEGIKFLTDERYSRYLEGLEIDVERVWGREQVVAENPSLSGGGC